MDGKIAKPVAQGSLHRMRYLGILGSDATQREFFLHFLSVFQNFLSAAMTYHKFPLALRSFPYCQPLFWSYLMEPLISLSDSLYAWRRPGHWQSLYHRSLRGFNAARQLSTHRRNSSHGLGLKKTSPSPRVARLALAASPKHRKQEYPNTNTTKSGAKIAPPERQMGRWATWADASTPNSRSTRKTFRAVEPSCCTLLWFRPHHTF